MNTQRLEEASSVIPLKLDSNTAQHIQGIFRKSNFNLRGTIDVSSYISPQNKLIIQYLYTLIRKEAICILCEGKKGTSWPKYHYKVESERKIKEAPNTNITFTRQHRYGRQCYNYTFRIIKSICDSERTSVSVLQCNKWT